MCDGNPVIRQWEEVKAALPGRAVLLLGNGFSVNIWSLFRYSSLYQVARDRGFLTQDDEGVFDEFESRDFEFVLSRLSITARVLTRLQRPDEYPRQCHDRIRAALIKAVKEVHVLWARLSAAEMQTIGDELDTYRAVFSLSYDLIAYWCLLSVGTDRFTDLFWGPGDGWVGFDPLYCSPSHEDPRTLLYYLHGGIHLCEGFTGSNYKKTAEHGNLLDTFGDCGDTPSWPLFVSEGEGVKKAAAIRRSEYLRFAYQSLADSNDSGSGIVLFGVGLAESDSHIVKALQYRCSDGRTVAVSIYDQVQNPEAEVARYRGLLPGRDLRFFWSSSHPLGNASLTVQP